MEMTCGRRKSQARSSWMKGATKPPAAASTWMGTSHPFSSFSFTAIRRGPVGEEHLNSGVVAIASGQIC